MVLQVTLCCLFSPSDCSLALRNSDKKTKAENGVTSFTHSLE
jgi:hypothetical protein